jgi:hypothetical protein
MKGCVLAGRFVFANPEKNRSRRQRPAQGDGRSHPPVADPAPTEDQDEGG